MKSLPLVVAAGCLALAGCGDFPDLDDRFAERATTYPALEPIDPLLDERAIARTPDGLAEDLAARRDALIARSSRVDTSGLSLAERQRLEGARTRQVALAPQSDIDAATLLARGDALRARGQQAAEAGASVLLRDAGTAIADAEAGDADLIARTEELRARRDRLREADARAGVALSELADVGTDLTEEERARIQRLRNRAEELRRRAEDGATDTN